LKQEKIIKFEQDMKQDIICENGRCFDRTARSCEDRFTDINEIIECEQLEMMKPKMS